MQQLYKYMLIISLFACFPTGLSGKVGVLIAIITNYNTSNFRW